MRNALQKLCFEDLALFEAIARHGSLAAGAREMRLRPSHVSKIIQRIETTLDVSLFKRTTVGISLTAEGVEFLEICKKLLETLDQTKWISGSAIPKQVPLFTMVGPMFLLAHLVGPNAMKALKEFGQGLRLLQMTESEMLASSSQGHFDLALHCEPLAWSRAWTTHPIGTVERVLCARADHPLPSRCSEKELLQFPFVVSSWMTPQGPRLEEDHCPVPMKQRLRIVETSSGEIALRTLTSTDQVVFLPKIQAQTFIQQKILRVIECKDWLPSRKPVYLTVSQDRLSQKWVKALIQSLEAGLVMA